MTKLEARGFVPEDKSEFRTSVDVYNEIRNWYLKQQEGRSLGYEVVSEVLKQLEESEGWEEFFVKQEMTPRKLELYPEMEKVAALAKEYFKIREAEENQSINAE
ncbi:MAG: hypothetical protein ACM3KM_02935 [Acidobacteriaceae bacterium]